jgi:hypothetical protein
MPVVTPAWAWNLTVASSAEHQMPAIAKAAPGDDSSVAVDDRPYHFVRSSQSIVGGRR